MRSLITTLLLVLLPFGAGAEVPPMVAKVPPMVVLDLSPHFQRGVYVSTVRAARLVAGEPHVGRPYGVVDPVQETALPSVREYNAVITLRETTGLPAVFASDVSQLYPETHLPKVGWRHAVGLHQRYREAVLPRDVAVSPITLVMAETDLPKTMVSVVTPVQETRLPEVAKYLPIRVKRKVRLDDFHSAPSPYWSLKSGPRISEAKAAAWEDELKLCDDPNTDVVADAIDTSTLKIVCAGPIGLHNNDKYTNTVPVKAYLIEQKALGYNAVLFEWLTGATTAPALRDLMEWANGEFDTIILAPVPSAFGTAHKMPKVAKLRTTLNALMGQADAVLLGWGFTIDTVLMGDEGSKGFCKRFFRGVERRAAANGVPVWGNLYTRYHGGDWKYQYTPENHTAYVCGNIAPSGMFMSADIIKAKVAIYGISSAKPIILGPFRSANADKSVTIYNSLGFGAIKMERMR
jgi:hypothetical protein